MKNTFIKKTTVFLTSMITACAMTSSLNTSAVDSPTKDNLPAYNLTTSSTVAEIPVKKDIVLFNSEKKRIPEPNITYNYEIASANVTSAQISTVDADSNTVILAVRPGIIEAVTAITDSGDSSSAMVSDGVLRRGTITFGADNENLKYTNKETSVPYIVSVDYKATRQMNLKIDASKIYDVNADGVPDNEPGVYRYKITDITTNETYEQSGVEEGSANDTIFLDVYTKYNDTKDNLVVYGYVLLKSTTDGENTSITYNETADETVKIDGFVTTDEGDDNGDGEVIPADFKGDIYKTYNVDIEKQVVGDLADRHHEFPFKIELSNATIKNSADFSVNDGTKHSVTNFTALSTWKSSDVSISGIDFKLKHGEKISLIGLPTGTKVTVSETNDTEDVYSVSASFNNAPKGLINGDSSQTGSSISIHKDDTASLTDSYLVNTMTESDKVIITNTLRDVSVTGVLMNIAPFLFITGAGILLCILYLRNKKENNTDNII